MNIFIAGDSTFQDNDDSTYPQTGIGQRLPAFFVSDGRVRFINRARNGRSTKSFIAEGRLESIRKEICAGDYLFVIFGHNDEKLYDPSRGTEPYGEFIENLQLFADAAESHGAVPLFFTPITRRNLSQTHGLYPAAITDFAKASGYPVIDLYTATAEYVRQLGDTESKKLYMNFPPGEYANYPEGRQDDTHLRPEGAGIFAAIAAEQIAALSSCRYTKYDQSYAELAGLVIKTTAGNPVF